MFVLDDTANVTINFVPNDDKSQMKANLEFRLINSQERQFMNQTLALMGIGFVLILGFLIILFKALNLS